MWNQSLGFSEVEFRLREVDGGVFDLELVNEAIPSTDNFTSQNRGENVWGGEKDTVTDAVYNHELRLGII